MIVTAVVATILAPGLVQSGSDQEEKRRLSRQLQQLQQANAKEMKVKVSPTTPNSCLHRAGGFTRPRLTTT